MEFLEIELALSYKIATLPQTGDSRGLYEQCYSTALRGYNTGRDVMLGQGLMGTQTRLEAKLDRLRAALADIRPGKIMGHNSAKHAHAQIRPTEVVEIASGPGINAHSEGRSPMLLTAREIEVLTCIAEGHSTKEVAGILEITFRTAASHRYNIMSKLGIHDTVNLVRYAIRHGMVQV
jgi:DNA-binding NarL/FixJ family response regulator